MPANEEYVAYIKKNYIEKFAETFKIDFKSKFLVDLWAREFAKFTTEALDEGWDTFLSTVSPNYLPKLDMAKDIFRIEANRINERDALKKNDTFGDDFPVNNDPKFAEVTKLAMDLLAGKIEKIDYYRECEAMYRRFGMTVDAMIFKKLADGVDASQDDKKDYCPF